MATNPPMDNSATPCATAPTGTLLSLFRVLFVSCSPRRSKGASRAVTDPLPKFSSSYPPMESPISVQCLLRTRLCPCAVSSSPVSPVGTRPPKSAPCVSPSPSPTDPSTSIPTAWYFGDRSKIPGKMKTTSDPPIDPNTRKTTPRSLTNSAVAVVIPTNTTVWPTCRLSGARPGNARSLPAIAT